ncbi:MAG: hypothetical protein ABSA32_07995 [Candidatus Acidiferrales bacterium]
MKRAKGTKTEAKAQHSRTEVYLTVDSSGMVTADSTARADLPGHETWTFEYAGDHGLLQKLFPTRGDIITLPIDRHSRELIEIVAKRASAESIRSRSLDVAESALFCYGLRFRRVRAIDMHMRIVPTRNLRAQIQNGEIDSLLIMENLLVLDPSDQDGPNESSLDRLKRAYLFLEGVAGCRRDATGAGYDATNFAEQVNSIPELAGLFITSSNESDLDPMSDLMNLALEIIENPIVARRLRKLAGALARTAALEQPKIERIIRPETFPDYSRRIAEIAEKFGIRVPQIGAKAPRL